MYNKIRIDSLISALSTMRESYSVLLLCTAPSSLTVALPGVVTASLVSCGIFKDSPADQMDVFQQTFFDKGLSEDDPTVGRQGH